MDTPQESGAHEKRVRMEIGMQIIDFLRIIPALITAPMRKLSSFAIPLVLGRFKGSRAYWVKRYRKGGGSGVGSYNELAEFKAEVLNGFVKEHNIETVIEFGCGDGNQLRYACYPSYLGFDISPEAVSICRRIFQQDENKRFFLLEEYSGQKADLTLSLDVIYHLTEDDVFHDHMDLLFNASKRFVIIYSSNTDDNSANHSRHVKHRKFTSWVEKRRPEWRLTRHIKNRYPYDGNNRKSSWSDFFIYEKARDLD